MSHQGYEESPERCQHRDVKCFRGECDALDRVYQLDEDNRARKDATERERDQALMVINDLGTEGGKIDGELNLDFQYHGKMFQGFTDLGNPQYMYWHISF